MRLAKALASARAVSGVISGVISGVVVSVINKTWLTPSPPQRQAVELSGGTHHRLAASGIRVSVRVSQPTLTVVRAPVIWRA